MYETKPFNISKYAVVDAYERVKANKGTYGVDRQSIKDFEKNRKDNLYKIWNRMSSGTYFPKPVRAVAIPKKNGGTRILGIPTVEDRVAQMVVKIYLEPKVERIFYKDSYGYRPNKSAIQAIGETRTRCWKRKWVLEYDIKGLFDNIKHEYLMEMVEKHTDEKWIKLYVKRWLTVPFKMEDGTIIERTSGTPQGGVISPALANLFMHYVVDDFMSKEFPNILWARYADDGVMHCVTLKQAKYLKYRLEKRLKEYGLELNKEKTRIVYCKDDDGNEGCENRKFDFLGYTFRHRRTKSKRGKVFTGFLPAISDKAKKAIRKEVRRWRIQLKSDKSINDIANIVNSKIQGWINYYAHFYKSGMKNVLKYINSQLIRWVKRVYRKSAKSAVNWFTNIARRDPKLFAHWKLGIILPMA